MIKHEKEFQIFLELATKMLPSYQEGELLNSKLPDVIAIEGIAGSGKSTQMENIKRTLTSDGRKIGYLELPYDSALSELLIELQESLKRGKPIAKNVPWLDTMLLMADYYTALLEKAEEGFDGLVMYRGFFSALIYNFKKYYMIYKDTDKAWEEANKLCSQFVKPKAVIYIDITVEEALKRIKERNRLPQRLSDTREGLVNSVKIYEKMFGTYSKEVKIYKIDGMKNIDETSSEIISIIKRELKE